MKKRMDFNADHFALFDLPRAFRIDAEALDRRYREIQAQIHPDRFADADETQRRLSLQWATKANEAYQTLRKPLARARYLLQILGHEVNAQNNTAMPTAFLIEQMEWRENVAEARAAGKVAELEEEALRARDQIERVYGELAENLDEQGDYQAAGDKVLRLMYLEKLLMDINEALTALEE